uniref:NADH dehydrogenase [ubiquinone] 1 alpha subcomplex subunit 12 n=1 Tax=Erythrolobus australicus TaxID=1077150 RepID=A0A7S1TNU8_9RHOD|mmetsp:Transcript_3972/g.10935  ORF Transcript_3972/g.10935 Transcript_3972/m.10935 type:complete len:169 (+) Transcript_3972:106-612(+)
MAKYVQNVRSLVSCVVEEAKWRGFWGTVRALKMNKFGSKPNLVGEDALGNRYFENRAMSYGRHRWVEYAEQRHVSFDSVKIPPEWHAWVSYISDELPSRTPPAKPAYQAEITRNMTGTKDRYVSNHSLMAKHYSGRAREKVRAWDPSAARTRTALDLPADGKDIYDLK